MSLVTLLLFVAGLALLVGGAELLVRGASGLAARLGIAPLVIGLTVVAYGTSAPEMAVSTVAAVRGQSDIAYGNVVGSNIFNVLFILGVSAVITPLAVARQLTRVDVPIMIGVSLLLYVLALDGHISRTEGVVFVALLAGYTWLQVRLGRSGGGGEPEQVPAAPRSAAIQIAMIAVGLALLVLGSRWLVEGAVALARAFGLSELIIGLTIVAAGTSLPEVATSIVAALRGQRDIAVGNVVGSNVFNITGVLGVSALVARAGVPVSAPAIAFDTPVMLAVAVACLPVFLTGHLIARWQGWVFLLFFAAYTAFLVLDARDHDALPLFSLIMGAFVLPLSSLAILGAWLAAWRKTASAGPVSADRPRPR